MESIFVKFQTFLNTQCIALHTNNRLSIQSFITNIVAGIKLVLTSRYSLMTYSKERNKPYMYLFIYGIQILSPGCLKRENDLTQRTAIKSAFGYD